jgi:hypothetical protein
MVMVVVRCLREKKKMRERCKVKMGWGGGDLTPLADFSVGSTVVGFTNLFPCIRAPCGVRFLDCLNVLNIFGAFNYGFLKYNYSFIILLEVFYQILII